MFTSIDTAIQNMIQNTIDEQDFVCRLDAEQYTDNEITDLKSDNVQLQDEIAELMVRLEELESRTTSLELIEDGEPLMAPEAPAAVEQEPRAENQIDWIMTPTNIISGYDSKALLLSYIGSVLAPSQSHQAEMVIGMVLATARNLIDKQLKGES